MPNSREHTSHRGPSGAQDFRGTPAAAELFSFSASLLFSSLARLLRYITLSSGLFRRGGRPLGGQWTFESSRGLQAERLEGAIEDLTWKDTEWPIVAITGGLSHQTAKAQAIGHLTAPARPTRGGCSRFIRGGQSKMPSVQPQVVRLAPLTAWLIILTAHKLVVTT